MVGSLLASLLGQKGYEVAVYEKRPDPRTALIDEGRSINLALSHRGIAALKLAGLDEQVLANAIPMKGRLIHDEKGNKKFQPYGEEGQVIHSVSRATLNKILISNAEKKGVRFNFNHRIIDFSVHNRLIQFGIDGEEKTLKPNLLVGADGAFSEIRNGFHQLGEFDFQKQVLEHGYKELTIPPDSNGAHRMEPNALHIWPREQFMLIGLPNPDGTFTCTLFLPFKGEVSFEVLKDEHAVNLFFEKYFPDAHRIMPDLTSEFFHNPVSALTTISCFPWTHNNTLLIGDAAHAIVPFYGQGMNAGFEDCRILMETLNSRPFAQELLDAFQKRRKPSADAISKLALQNFIEMRDLVADETFLLRKRIEALIHEKLKEHYLPLYSMVTFSDMPYELALKKGMKQDVVMDEIMKLEGIKDNWMKEEYWPEIKRVIEERSKPEN